MKKSYFDRLIDRKINPNITTGRVIDVNDEGKYKVSINGTSKWMKSTKQLVIDDIVMVALQDGDINKAQILDKSSRNLKITPVEVAR